MRLHQAVTVLRRSKSGLSKGLIVQEKLGQYLAEVLRKVAVALALGGIAGAAIIQSHHDEKRKSQAEKDDPDGVEWICGLVWDLLDDWEPSDYEREDAYTDDLLEFLREELRGERGADGRRIRVVRRTKTFRGVPDILIDDRLVLELKVDPKETEKDRLVGQCCKYSQEWVTWAIVIDMPEERVDALVNLLDAKSLNYIEVIHFDDEDEDDDEDDDDDEEE